MLPTCSACPCHTACPAPRGAMSCSKLAFKLYKLRQSCLKQIKISFNTQKLTPPTPDNSLPTLHTSMAPTKAATCLLALLLAAAASTTHARDLVFFKHSRALKECVSSGIATGSASSSGSTIANAIQQTFAQCFQSGGSQGCDAVADAEAKVSRQPREPSSLACPGTLTRHAPLA